MQALAESFHPQNIDKINMGTVKKIVMVFALTIPLSFSATALVSWLVILKEKKLEVGDLCGRSY
jgi:phosphate/sulfate permease